jgi:hypothetical protein
VCRGRLTCALKHKCAYISIIICPKSDGVVVVRTLENFAQGIGVDSQLDIAVTTVVSETIRSQHHANHGDVTGIQGLQLQSTGCAFKVGLLDQILDGLVFKKGIPSNHERDRQQILLIQSIQLTSRHFFNRIPFSNLASNMVKCVLSGEFKLQIPASRDFQKNKSFLIQLLLATIQKKQAVLGSIELNDYRTTIQKYLVLMKRKQCFLHLPLRLNKMATTIRPLCVESAMHSSFFESVANSWHSFFALAIASICFLHGANQ